MKVAQVIFFGAITYLADLATRFPECLAPMQAAKELALRVLTWSSSYHREVDNDNVNIQFRKHL